MTLVLDIVMFFFSLLFHLRDNDMAMMLAYKFHVAALWRGSPGSFSYNEPYKKGLVCCVLKGQDCCPFLPHIMALRVFICSMSRLKWGRGLFQTVPQKLEVSSSPKNPD